MRYLRQINKVPANLNVIFIGDSYGAGYGLSNTSHNWIEYAAAWLGGATGSNKFAYKKSAVNGSGFIGGDTNTTFLKQLQGITTVGAESNLDVTDIVVCAGYNDMNKNESALNQAFYDFQQYCLKNYPYATIHIGFIGWQCCEKKGSLSKVEINQAMERYVRCARENRMAYIGNIHYIMHDYSLFQNDGIHPNEGGQYRIASAVVTHLLGGQVEAIDSYRQFSPNWNANISDHGTSDAYFTWRHNNRSGIWIGNTSWVFSNPVSFSGHPADDSNGVGWYTLFDFSGGLCEGNNTNQAVKTALPVAYKNSNGEWTTAMTWFWFAIENNKTVLKISPYVVGAYATDKAAGYGAITNVVQVMCNVGSLSFDFDSLYC